MSTNPNKSSDHHQLCILDFVDSPNYNSGKNRIPRSTHKITPKNQTRGTSSSSTSRKRKRSQPTPTNTENNEKRRQMNPESETEQQPLSEAEVEQNSFTTALKAMEQRLTDTFTKMITPLQKSVDSLVVSQKEWEASKIEVKELQQAKIKLNADMKTVMMKNSELEERVKSLEDKLMENNLIIHGISEGKWEVDSTRNELVYQSISSTVDAPDEEQKLAIARNIPIASTSRIGKYNPSRSRPIRVSFSCKSDADLLLERKKKLQKGIFVDREYNNKDERERKLLRPILRAARRLTKYRGKCKLDGTKLIIQGKKYTRSNLDSLPEDIDGFNVTSKDDGDCIGFFGELNPLSNFHPAKFTYNGFEYNSSEQLIQHQKALRFGDRATANKIMECKEALDCKQLSREITNYDHEIWKKEAKTKCEEGIKAKFYQNQHLRLKLLGTGSKKLVECCNDILWGNGIPLYDEECLNRSKWTSQGILGEILENIRSNITDIMGINNNPPTEGTTMDT